MFHESVSDTWEQDNNDDIICVNDYNLDGKKIKLYSALAHCLRTMKLYVM